VQHLAFHPPNGVRHVAAARFNETEILQHYRGKLVGKSAQWRNLMPSCSSCKSKQYENGSSLQMTSDTTPPTPQPSHLKHVFRSVVGDFDAIPDGAIKNAACGRQRLQPRNVDKRV
jgi:hypothetical protein